MLGEFFTTTIGKLLVIDVVIQWVAFVVANHYKTEKFYDLTGTHTILMTCFGDKLLFGKRNYKNLHSFKIIPRLF